MIKIEEKKIILKQRVRDAEKYSFSLNYFFGQVLLKNKKKLEIKLSKI